MNTKLLNKLDELKRLALPVEISPSIGIGITTHNRYDIFKKTYDEIKRFAPANAKIAVVDDASDKPVPEAAYRFNSNAGIAGAKNKCFELLYNAGCEHFFLFDDDCYPVVEDWYKPYTESTEPHLNYIFEEFGGTGKPALNDTLLLYKDSKIKAYSHVRGCMCYYKRICLDICGGMSPLFGRWGYEHPDLSNRIYNAGLTTFRYMDVPDSGKLFYSRDEHTGNADSTVQGAARTECIKKNSPIYDSRKDEAEYVELREKENIILTCFFTKLKDAQRENEASMKADKALLKTLVDSMNGQKLIVLNDCFDDEINGDVRYIKVETHINNAYFQRWISEYRYIIQNRNRINRLFLIDSTDVRMLNNPFPCMESGRLYVGDEAGRTGCEWMIKHHPHKLIQDFIKQNENRVLLNCGIVGGDVDMVISLINKFLTFYFQSITDKHFKGQPDCGQFEMGLFNYIARTHFANHLVHGTQVNTVFKAEKANNASWFRHK
jgi:glycosyltransferase involved in cell wall biosynthesis